MLGRVRDAVRKYPLALLFAVTLLMLGVFPRLRDRLTEGDGKPRAGALLLARPGGMDENFRETVVLLVDGGGANTWGVVLNRVRTPRGETLPTGVSRWGGPVQPEYQGVLLRAKVAPEGARRVLDGLYWLEGAPREELTAEVQLTFAGYAAWAPGQLEKEIAHGGWRVLQGDPETPFLPPESLWTELVARHL